MAKEKNKKQVTGTNGIRYVTVIAALTMLLYAPSLKNELLTFDDNDYFAYKEVRELSWDGIVDIFTSHHLIMYQPLPVLSFAIQHHFSGTNGYPYHLVNVLLHLLCVFAVYGFVKRLTQDSWMPVVIAGLFAIHPMNVEPVVWMSARSSMMYALFYLLALMSYVDYLKSDRTKKLGITGAFFIIALFCKVQAITLPLALLLLDYYFGKRVFEKSNLLAKTPFVLLSAIFGFIAISDTATQSNFTDGMLANYNWMHVPFMATWSFCFYLFKLILPIELCAIYTYPILEDGMLPWSYYASVLPVAGLVWLLWRNRHDKQVLFASGFFLFTIIINIQLIPSRLFIVADRYAYIPYVGLFMLLYFIATSDRMRYRTKGVLPYILAVFALFFSITTYSRSQQWSSDIPFLTDIIDKNEGAPYIYRAYGNRAVKLQSLSRFEESLADYTKAIELFDGDGKTYFNRSKVFMALNRNREALSDLDSAAARDSGQAALYSLRGQVHLMLNDTASCIRDSERSIGIDSLDFDAWNTLATVAYSRADYVVCRQYLDKAISAKPDFAIAIKNRGLLNLKLGMNKEACLDFQTASYMNNADAKGLYVQYCK
ncbi:MAG: glycosyltransferase family 39 protein [Bacteroidota bacterium]|jgi:tetratricopeptide (TPR) repeat protein